MPHSVEVATVAGAKIRVFRGGPGQLRERLEAFH